MSRRKKNVTTVEDIVGHFRQTYPSMGRNIFRYEWYDVGQVLVFLLDGIVVVYDDDWNICVIVDDDWRKDGTFRTTKRVERLRSDMGCKIQRQLNERRRVAESIRDKQKNRGR